MKARPGRARLAGRGVGDGGAVSAGAAIPRAIHSAPGLWVIASMKVQSPGPRRFDAGRHRFPGGDDGAVAKGLGGEIRDVYREPIALVGGRIVRLGGEIKDQIGVVRPTRFVADHAGVLVADHFRVVIDDGDGEVGGRIRDEPASCGAEGSP